MTSRTPIIFTDYQTCQQVQTAYQLQYQEDNFIPERWTDTSIVFDLDFQFYESCTNIEQSDVAKRELITLPILKELYQNCGGVKGSPEFWIAPHLKLDDQLSGTVDYLFAAQSELGRGTIGLPILVIVIHAQQNNFEVGWAHCLAALVVSDFLNQQLRPVYGIVTNGQLWEFGRLHNRLFTKHPVSYDITDLNKLFFMLNGFFDLATQDLSTVIASK